MWGKKFEEIIKKLKFDGNHKPTDLRSMNPKHKKHEKNLYQGTPYSDCLVTMIKLKILNETIDSK